MYGMTARPVYGTEGACDQMGLQIDAVSLEIFRVSNGATPAILISRQATAEILNHLDRTL